MFIPDHPRNQDIDVLFEQRRLSQSQLQILQSHRKRYKQDMNNNITKRTNMIQRMFKNVRRGLACTTRAVITSLLIYSMAIPLPGQAAAGPTAGTSIGNQASATYLDASNTERTVTSNVAITIVQQVASLTLTSDNTKTVARGGNVYFPHTLVNTGNGSDIFSFTTLNTGTFSFTEVDVYADANGDGVPDNNTPITSTGSIPPGGTFKFVVEGAAPGTATAGQSSTIKITATSTFNNTISAFNTDVATVSERAVINITKSFDANSGASPSGPRTITLTYNNTGNDSATNLTILDVIQPGFTYVAGTARWSISGATALTDAAGGDPSGINYDFGVTVAGRVTAVIARVPSGQSGTLTFQVNINSGLAPGALNNTASYTYDDGSGTTVGPFNSNTSQFTVTQSSSVTITGQTIPSMTQGGTVIFTNVVSNTGNGADNFDILVGTSSFPSGTTFSLFQSDAVSPLLDSNNNGAPDTGPIQPGATYNVIIKAILPSTASGGGPYTVQKTARSITTPSVTATTTDTLTTILASVVDLTNDQALPGTGIGEGAGPEASPVKTVTVNPASAARFTLYVNNSSTVADSYTLSASTNANFSSTTLYAGWAVVFHDAGGSVLTTTGVLQPGQSKLVYADISVAAGAAPGNYEVYFRVLSPTTGASDRKHDRVAVNTYRSITLQPDNTGQVSAGGSVVYSHTIVNNGNVVEGDGTTSVVLTRSDAGSGFTSVVYWDQNNNGVLDTTDPVITDLSTLVGGVGGASTAAGLDPGESARIFVKVFAPAGVLPGTVNTTTLKATTTGGNGTPPPQATATDTTTVIAGDIILLKEQALDANHDGTPEGAYSTTTITTGAVSGASIRYRITVTNQGSAVAKNVVVSDSTPSYTSYTTTGPAATTVGTVTTAPANGGKGLLQFTLGDLNPGQSVVITFGVTID